MTRQKVIIFSYTVLINYIDTIIDKLHLQNIKNIEITAHFIASTPTKRTGTHWYAMCV